MKSFLNKDFLLSTPTAVELYHEHAAKMPIVDYHCHLDPQQIYEDVRFENITQVWLGGDHYKWRIMRSNGVDEYYITGSAPDREKFQKFAEALPRAIGNPMYHWCHLELKNFFGYEGVLNGKTAEEVWNLCNAKLAEPEFSARGLIKASNVAMIGTTDDPCSDLKWHKLIAEEGKMDTKVCPSFRPDPAVNIHKAGFAAYMEKLSAASGIMIEHAEDVCKALSQRIDFFNEVGCRASDHGLDYIMYHEATAEEIEAAFQKGMSGQIVTGKEAEGYQTYIVSHCAREYARHGWAMQLHFSCVRNTNTNMFKALGPDTGFDGIASTDSCLNLHKFLDNLNIAGQLPKTIVYSLNPADYEFLGELVEDISSNNAKRYFGF